jgi:hypothetical protein
MDCNECKLEMVNLFDSEVDQATLAGMMEHLLHCPDCSGEYDETMKLLAALKPKLQPSAPSMLKQRIINQLIKDEAEMKNETTKVRWLSSRTRKIISIAAVLLLAMLIIPFTFKNDVFMSSTTKAANKFIEMSIDATQAIRSMVMKLKVRTIPRDNFALVGTDLEMVEHTITKSFENPVKWRIDKGERVAVFDGNNQYLWMPNFEQGVKAGPNAGFIGWFKILLDPQAILSKEQNVAKDKNSKVTMKQNGNEMLMTVTSNAMGNFINDYSKNKSIEESDNRREYIFDNNTKLLKGLKIYIIQGKKETLILETEKIDYDVPVDPSLFAINLPASVEWKEITNNYTSETFKNIGSKRAAELFFQGMANNDWKLVGETCDFFNGNSKRVQEAKEDFGGLTVIHIGEPFKSGLFPGEFVPYEIKFKSGNVKKFNLALKNNNPNKVWIVSGGF